jgi:outer membrane protein insertion porin family
MYRPAAGITNAAPAQRTKESLLSTFLSCMTTSALPGPRENLVHNPRVRNKMMANTCIEALGFSCRQLGRTPRWHMAPATWSRSCTCASKLGKGLIATILKLLVSLSALVLAAHAQEAAKASEFLYEGQKVALVELVGKPHFDVESLRPLVLQKAGEPYANDKVQRTVAALNGTGRFSKVDVEVTLGTEGLKILFVLEPAYYIGMISFPGAVKTFAYARLLDVVNYHSQEAYDESRIKAAIPALERFFAFNGYFTAHVTSETQLDEQHYLANVRFSVALNKRAKFGAVEVHGLPEREQQHLHSAFRSLSARLKGASLIPGKPYNTDHLRAATALIRTHLSKANLLASQIRREPAIYHPETNRADINFQVTPGPTVDVRTSGVRVSKGELQKLIPIYEENAFDEDLVEEGKRNLVNHFQKKGYFDVKVESRIERDPKQILVVYAIDRGNKHRVEDVDVRGNQHFSEKDLKDQVVVKEGRFLSHGQFNRDLVNRSSKNLAAFYQDAGFADVKVDPAIDDRDPKLYVTFKIVEASQTLVDSLRFEGNDTQPVSALAPGGLKLTSGQPYSPSRLNEDRNQIVANYLNLGYLNVTFRSTVTPLENNPHRVAVTYIIEEGPRTHISQVAFIGTQHTRQGFIQRNTTVHPGNPLGEGTLLESESKLYNLGVFDWADVSPLKPITDQPQEQVVVRVHEDKRNTLGYGFGFQSTARAGSLSSGTVSLPGLPAVGLPSDFTIIEKTIISPLGSFDYSRSNLFGRGETCSVSALLSRLDQRGTITYTVPQFRGSLNWNALWSASAERTTQNPLYSARTWFGSLQVEKILDTARTQRLQFRYSFQQTSLSDLLIQNFVPPEDQSVKSSFLSAAFVRDTRDMPLDAHKGVFQTVDLRVIPKVLGSDESFFRFFAQTAYYRQVAPWMVWANSVRYGFVKAFADSHVPFADQFFSGGADSLRGFPLNGAGPQQEAVLCTEANNPSTCTAKVTVPSGGRQLFIFNSEGRFPIPLTIGPVKGLGGVIFYDGGNVYRSVGFSRFLTDYTNTIGFGLRYATPIGPVRIDIGHNLNPTPGLRSTQIFVTLGQAF